MVERLNLENLRCRSSAAMGRPRWVFGLAAMCAPILLAFRNKLPDVGWLGGIG